MSKNEINYEFEGFSICMPETWEYSAEEDLLTIYVSENGKGALQISSFRRIDDTESLRETAEKHLKMLIGQYDIRVDINTYKIIEGPSFTVANASGQQDADFIKAWVLANECMMLLATYISPKKTRELSTVENIVYSVRFDDE